jgi:hypothetical protein
MIMERRGCFRAQDVTVIDQREREEEVIGVLTNGAT